MNLQTSLFLIFCALLLGIAIGGIVASLRMGKNPDEPEGESKSGDLIRLRKDQSSGALEVVVAGQAFRSASEMSSVQRTLAGYAAHDLNSWLSLQTPSTQTQASIAPLAAAAAATAAAASVPPTEAAAAPSVVSSATPASESPTAEKVSEALPAQPVSDSSVQTGDLGSESGLPGGKTGAEDPKKRKRGGLIGIFTRALAADTPTPRVMDSIAVQVNQILQKKLKGTLLESRGICLMELPGQEMVVLIGMEKYDSVSAVPDDEIRAVLQSAVDEWLARSAT